MDQNSKACSKCAEVKILDDFPRDKGKKDGRMSMCKVCHAHSAKNYRDVIKKIKHEDPVDRMKREFEELKLQITLENYEEITKKIAELAVQILNTPTSVFSISVTGFGEKSSIADSIVLSRMPLFLNRELKVIINPQEVRVEWASDNSSIKVRLPDQIKLTKPQIVSLNQFLLL